AAVAVACAEYVVRVAGLSPAAVTPLAVGIMVSVAAFHALGIKPGAVLVNIITVGKTLALGALAARALAPAGASGITVRPPAPPRGPGGAPAGGGRPWRRACPPCSPTAAGRTRASWPRRSASPSASCPARSSPASPS